MEATLAPLIAAVRDGDRSAADSLFAALYSELHRIAKRQLARQGSPISLGATTLLHQAYVEIAAQDGASFPTEDLEDVSALAGHTVGSYTLIAPIAQGGMGSVWLAKRSDGRFDRQVAVKFLNYSLTSQSSAERFKREGKILG